MWREADGVGGEPLECQRAVKLEGGIDGTSTDGKWRMGIGDDSVVTAGCWNSLRVGDVSIWRALGVGLTCNGCRARIRLL